MSAFAPLRAATSRWSLTRVSSLLAGGLSGLFLFVWIHQILATFGESLVVTSGVALAIAFGLVLGMWTPVRVPVLRTMPLSILWLVPALWTVAFPWLLDGAVGLLRWCPMVLLTSDTTAFLLLTLLATGLLTVPVTVCVMLTMWPVDCGTSRIASARVPAGSWAGCGVALWLCALVAAPLVGVNVVGLCAALAAAAAFWIGLAKSSDASAVEWSEVSGDATSQPGHPATAQLGTAALALLLGAELAIISRLLLQLMPDGAYLHVSLWSGVLLGIGAGEFWSMRRSRARLVHDRRLRVSLGAAACPLLLLLFMPLLREAMLWTSATLSSVVLLTAFRAGVLMLAVMPLGWAWSELCHVPSGDRQRTAWNFWLPGILWGVAGLLCIRSMWPAPATTLVLCSVASLLCAASRWRLEHPEADTRRSWGLSAGALGLVAFAVLLRGNYRPDLAASLLFSTNTFAAYSQGTEPEMLAHLDDARLLAVADRVDATWTLWKTQGVRVQFRRDGIPAGYVSVLPEVCPQPAGDVMHAAVPLAVHPRPDDVLLLGVGNTVTLSSCLSCPVRRVTCVEGDRGLLETIGSELVPRTGINLFADDRVQLRTADVTLAALAERAQYDVILVMSSQPAFSQQSAHFTQEWCRQMSRLLKPGGLFCQRLSYVDFGRQPIEDAIATMRSAFPQMICQEVAPGELLLMASNSDQPIIDAALIKRCEAPHIRRLMAQVGWDWSVMLNLSALRFPAEGGASDAGRINTVANGRFAFGLPQETMRWGAKWQELRQFWIEHGERMLAWVGESSDLEEVVSRLADMTEQHRLIAGHPDRFWIYRDTLKQRLTERPRARIVQVSHEGLKRTLHPEDERRKEYLLTLGAAAAEDSPQAIRHLSDFAEPYDPLVSYFLHREAARLYDEVSHPDLPAQLDHLMYSIYFAPPQDRSVRNVVSAIELILDHEELIPHPEERWDRLNGLVEILKHRCQLRMSQSSGSSRFEVINAEKSITAAKRALTAMDLLRPQIDVDSDSWNWRRMGLERYLVRPMRTYQASQAGQLATLQARQRRVAEAVSTEGASDDTKSPLN